VCGAMLVPQRASYDAFEDTWTIWSNCHGKRMQVFALPDSTTICHYEDDAPAS
jgi:hypothetical protein